MTNKQSSEDGTLSKEEINWLLMRAEGGFGIITTAATHVVMPAERTETPIVERLALVRSLRLTLSLALLRGRGC